MKKTKLGTATMVAPSSLEKEKSWASDPVPTIQDDISLAQWSLVDEVKAGIWKTVDFAKIAREDFGLNGIEYVNTLLEVPTEDYLKKLRTNASDHNVISVLIMVDEEGDGCSPTKEGRRQFEINHRKWIDAAHYLGCTSIRTNCRGPENVNKAEALAWASESYRMLLQYAIPAKVKVVIENHGGVSNDPDFIVALMKEVDNPYFGTYPDWREPSDEFDNYIYLKKTLPYAGGMSYRNQPTEELTAKMIQLAKSSGYHGWYGIESSGRDAIEKGKALLKKYLFEN